MKNIISLSILTMLIMVGVMLPVAMSSTDSPDAFNITINSGQNTAVSVSTDTIFDAALAGSSNNSIADSFDLTNSGNVAATVNATFTTSVDGVYGLTNTTYVIGGNNFSLAENSQSLVTLDNLATDTATGADNNVAADAVADQWKVELDVPAGQTAAIYSGTIQLTFADV